MTVVNPKSISGINSITTGSGSDNLLTIHTSDANNTERVRVNSSGDVIVGSGITVSPDGNIFATGIITATSYSGIDLSAVTGATGDFSIADKIVHTGDTNTAIRFPDADTITTETGGSERVRITSGGSVLVGKTATSLTTDGVRIDPSLAAITASSTSTNQSTANGATLYLINSSATDNNFSNIGGYNSNGLVTSQINFINTSHSSRTGDITFRTHTGSSMPERLKIASGGDVTVNTGNLVIGTSGKGIDFSATSDLSGSSSELLDDYEEGTYTSVLTGSGGGTHNIVGCSYVKTGRQVSVQVSLANPGSNSVSGNWSFTLPFQAVNASGFAYFGGYITYTRNLPGFSEGDGNFCNYAIHTYNGQSSALFYKIRNGSGEANLISGSLDNDAILAWTIVYNTST